MASIYVHFPYCASRCIYCDFYSSIRRDWGRYAEALAEEAERRKGFLRGVPPRTLYFGGGTPSLLPDHIVADVVESLRRNFDLSDVEEFTVEVNPDDVTPLKADELRESGVNRISMGVQSMCDEHLKWMRRRHTAEDVRTAFGTLRAAGFHNISIDLIFGFAGLSDETWLATVDAALALAPDHISCYQMMGRHADSDEDRCERQYLALQKKLSAAGFEQYEISNYCRPGFRSRHNSAYWRRDPYLGLGAAAHSFDGEKLRCWNVSDIDGYLSGSPMGSETLTDPEVEEEEIMLSLRTAEGAEEPVIKRKPAANRLIAAGYLVCENSRVRIPKEKFLVSDWIIRELFE